MFSKKDRYVIELEVAFNISAINRWLQRKESDIKDTEKMSPDWSTDDIIKTYTIDILPNGEKGDTYFHREKSLFTRNVGGIDFNFSTGDSSINSFIQRSKVINILEWGLWRESISLSVNRKPVLLAPIKEIVELQIEGKLQNRKTLREDDELIKVPLVYESSTDNTPKELVGIWRSSASDRSIGYKNALAAVSAHTLNFEVEY